MKKSKQELKEIYKNLDKRTKEAKDVRKEISLLDSKPKESIKYEIPDFDSILNMPEVDEVKSKSQKKIFENLKTEEVDDEKFIDMSEFISNSDVLENILESVDNRMESFYESKTEEKLFGAGRNFERKLYIQIIKLNITSMQFLLSPIQAFGIFTVYFYSRPMIKIMGVRKNGQDDDERENNE